MNNLNNIITLKNKIYNAACNLCGGAYFIMEGDDSYDNIKTWLTENPPTKEMVELEATRLQNEWDAAEYQRLRAPEYPPIGDQLDALWKGGDAATEMLARVQSVKDKYPKP